MTKQLFQQTFGGEFKKFIESPAGQAFLITLNAAAPAYEAHKEEHLFIDNRGAKRGYQICISNILGLSFINKTSQEPEVNYGVPNKTQPT